MAKPTGKQQQNQEPETGGAAEGLEVFADADSDAEINPQEGADQDRADDQVSDDVEIERQGDDHVVVQRPKQRGSRAQESFRQSMAAENQRRDREMEHLRSELGRVTGMLETALRAGPPQQQQQQQQPDFYSIADEQDELVQLIEKEPSPEKRAQLRRRWHDLERRRFAMVAQEAVAPHLQRMRNEGARDPRELELEHEFSDVFKNPDALALAKSHFIQAKRRANGARFNVYDAHRAALTWAGEYMGIYQPAQPAPHPSQLGRFVDTPASAARPAAGGPRNRPLTNMEKTAAEIWADGMGLTEEEAYAKYAKEVLMDGDPDYFRKPAPRS